MAFVRRIMTATFQLHPEQGDFGATGANTVTVSGLRMSAHIENAGGRSMGMLHLRIWGMSLSLMNKLSTLGQKINTGKNNAVTLAAGNDGETPGVVFKGTVNEAFADFNAAPDVPFEVLAQSAWLPSVAPALPISIRGSADVATLLSGLANQMSFGFENNGVNTKLAKSYYAGSLRDQAYKIVRDAGIEWNSLEGRVLAIWPRGGSRGGAVPLVSPQTGMIGYPVYTSLGVIIRTVFNPSIVFGGQIQLETSMTPAAGLKQVYKLDHELSTQVPNGRWESTFMAAKPGTVVVAF